LAFNTVSKTLTKDLLEAFLRGFFHETAVHYVPMTLEKLDGKYEVKREISRDTAVRSVEAATADGRAVRVDWFFVTDPKSRSNFHRYRTALKTANSPLMLDAVARPGAYYTVWQLESGASFEAWLEAHPKDDAFRQHLQSIASSLESFGFSLADTDVIAVEHRENGKAEVRPAIANLRLVERTPDEIKQLHVALLEPNKKPLKPVFAAKNKQKPSLKANPVVDSQLESGSKSVIPTLNPRRLTMWGIVPGIALLIGTGFFGQQVVQAFLQPSMVVVPNVVGKPVREAAKLLSETRLNTNLEKGNDNTQPQGIVLSQNPPKGTSLTETRVVSIVVNYPRPLIAPDLVGKLGTEAKITLKELGLVVGKVAIVPAAEGEPKGVVLAQNPIAGTQMIKGSSITILVSGARPEKGKTFIPDLTGLSFEEARAIIKMSGLTLVEINTRNSTIAKNTVLDQTPAPNKSVPLEGEATVTISTTANAQRPVVPEPIRPVRPVATPSSPLQPETQPSPVRTPITTPDKPETTPTSPTPPTNTSPALPEGQKPAEPTPTTPVAQPTPTSPTPQPTPTQPTPTPTPVTNQTRTVTFSYVVPADLGTVTLEVKVSDDDGERTIYGPLTVPGGTAIDLPREVRGTATFTVFIDGEPKHVAQL
jgi:beta-lactam-binding protein with PASTA domain